MSNSKSPTKKEPSLFRLLFFMAVFIFLAKTYTAIAGCDKRAAHDANDETLMIPLSRTKYGTCVSMERLVNAIGKIESGCKASAIGDNGKAVGVYQLHKIYVDDVNRIIAYRKRNGRRLNSSIPQEYSYDDRRDESKSREMVMIYLGHYAEVYEANSCGYVATAEILARIHNGGPVGYKKKSTEAYWRKVERELMK